MSTIDRDKQLAILTANRYCLDAVSARIAYDVLPILRGAQSLANCHQQQGDVKADQEMSCSTNELYLLNGLEHVSELLRIAINLLAPTADELSNIDLTDEWQA